MDQNLRQELDHDQGRLPLSICFESFARNHLRYRHRLSSQDRHQNLNYPRAHLSSLFPTKGTKYAD